MGEQKSESENEVSPEVLEQQHKQIEELRNQALQKGDTW